MLFPAVHPFCRRAFKRAAWASLRGVYGSGDPSCRERPAPAAAGDRHAVYLHPVGRCGGQPLYGFAGSGVVEAAEAV